MFNIFINDIIKASSKFGFILYADDTTLVSTLENFGTLNNVAELENAINCEISKISSWLVSNMLVLNVAKSKLMLFFKSEWYLIIWISAHYNITHSLVCK